MVADGAVSDADLAALPKAHLHLHLTGGMRHATLLELADRAGITLPDRLTDLEPDSWQLLGWPKFQRLYDVARGVLRTPEDFVRLLLEMAEDERAAGPTGGPIDIRKKTMTALRPRQFHSRVLYVDDEVSRTRAIIAALAGRGVEVVEASSLDEGRSAIASDASIECLLLDWTLGANDEQSHEEATELLLIDKK